jgi:4-hydroxybenzoate polyprenyltransferase
MGRLVRMFIFGCVWIACCAVALCMETNLLLHVPLNAISFYLFVFCATLAQYNLHYLLKKKANLRSERFAWSQRNRSLHLVFTLIGLAGLLICLPMLEIRHFYVLVAVAGLSLLYSCPLLPIGKRRLKDYGLLKITVLTLNWTLVTVWLPIDVAGVNPSIYWLVFIRRFLFLFVLCLLFDIRDVETDSSEGIGTIPVRWGIGRAYWLADGLLVLFVLCSLLHCLIEQNLPVLAGMILSAAATKIMMSYSKGHNNDYVYLAGIDGMMLLQAGLVIGAICLW